MLKISRSIWPAIVILLLMPLAVFAQDSGSNSSGSKAENVILAILPFIILAVLFWLFFVRQIKKQQSSAVQRHQAYWDTHEQHMKRMEQLLERIAVALEKDKGK